MTQQAMNFQSSCLREPIEHEDGVRRGHKNVGGGGGGSDLSAAMQMVPHVSAMSSTKMAILPSTDPTKTMLATSLAFCIHTC